MLTRRVWLGVALAALIVPAATLRGAEDKIDGDLKAIQGKWSMNSENGDKITYTVEGKKLKVVAPSRTYEMTLKLDAEAKPNKTIDFKIEEGPEDAKGQTSLGIYKLDGEKFVFCFAPQGERPSKFETEGYEKIVVTLSKDKD
ncbi:TIGR03067 domain-containing protein [Tundrisphaera lichenicola]|uniref:TIGR03067 domain-containing protein n=1 Tax=Tundrisphaera lichenicola TaxID=2029860 RepID=UPI003EBF1E3F